MATASRAPDTDSAVLALSAWGGILVATGLCGAIPALWNLTQLEGLRRPAFLGTYFALSTLLPAAAGLLAGTLWRRPRATGIVMLALGAGALEALLELLVIPHITVGGAYLTVSTEDYVAWAAVCCLFAAAGLYKVQRSRYHPRQTVTEPGNVRRRDMLQLATKVLGVVGPLLSLYVTTKKY